MISDLFPLALISAITIAIWFIHDRWLRRGLELQARPSDWRKAAEDWKQRHPYCALCDEYRRIEAHDIIPYHIDPDAWRTGRNFITLCHSCHNRFGHCRDPRNRKFDKSIEAAVKAYKEYSSCGT